MKVKFANGIIKDCSAPIEQKIFKTAAGVPVGIGWVLSLRLLGCSTSTELDEIVTADNVKSLEFLTDLEDGKSKTLFKLEDYTKITSSSIRHAENTADTYAELQISKGI